MPRFLVQPALAAAVAVVALAGCTSPGAVSQEEMALVRSANVPVNFDDPEPVFQKLFPKLISPLGKDPLETSAEFAGRLAATAVAGKEFTFLIAPELCEVVAFPDNNFYVIASKDSYYTREYRSAAKPYGMTVATKSSEPTTYVGQNAYGAKTSVTSFRETKLKIAPTDLAKLPKSLKWTKKEGDIFAHIGLPIRTSETSFREMLRAKRIGLAVKVKIGPLDKMDVSHEGWSPTITRPTSYSATSLLLPVELQAVWIVDTETKIGLMEMQLAPSK